MRVPLGVRPDGSGSIQRNRTTSPRPGELQGCAAQYRIAPGGQPKVSTMSTEYSRLLSPLKIGPKTVRNRVLVTAHEPRLAENFLPGDRYIAYQRARARGGAGLQLSGATPVHRSGMGGAHSDGLLIVDDGVVAAYRRLAEAIHAEGGCFLVQLAHYGATSGSSEPGQPIWGPSPVASELVRDVPHVMTVKEIAEVVGAFGAAARHVRASGLDGCEILAAFGLLVAAFLSPYSNHRGDAYGGSLENRMRFMLEIVDAVRAGAGPDSIVGVRIPGDELVAGGLGPAEMKEVARRLEAIGKVDYLNVAAGTNLDRVTRATHWGPTPLPHGAYVPLAAAIKAAVRLPVFTTGRITDPRQAEKILADGQADMIGMTRAHLADPDLVVKLIEGRADDIRPCVGANLCIASVLGGGHVRCIHNPEAGREHAWGPTVPAVRRKRVAIIGGGPAGLEAARVAALRGHRVTLYERSSQLGGHLRKTTAVPAMAELGKIIAWQEDQLRKLQVVVRRDSPVTPAEIGALDADAIVVATGSRPHTVVIPGAGDLPVLTPTDVFDGKAPPARTAVVWDESGLYGGIGAAEMLSSAGATVHLVTPSFMIGEDLDHVRRVPIYQRLTGAGCRFHPNARVARVEGRAVVLASAYDGPEERIEGVDLIVGWHGRRVDDDLATALDARGGEVHWIGDALAPRKVDIAMAEGAMVGRRL
ncbi:MAG: FAD-binding protein [Alphaproteobacteria bacterium]|nr:FAD-binding protein [Alphaproteobacteria bacterium]